MKLWEANWLHDLYVTLTMIQHYSFRTENCTIIQLSISKIDQKPQIDISKRLPVAIVTAIYKKNYAKRPVEFFRTLIYV